MEDYQYEPELKGETDMEPLQYNCTECQSLIEIISLNDKLDEIEFRCLKNSHRIKKGLNDYLTQIKKTNFLEIVNNKCECKGHNNCLYEYYCINCDKHLCNMCLKSKEHLYHIKFNIMTEISLSKEEEALIQKFIGYNEENNNNEKFKDIKELISIVYNYYSFYKNNYYLVTNLINLILCCCKNNKDLEKEFGFKEDDINRFMKLDKNYFIDNIEEELKLIFDTYKKILEQINKNKDLTIEKISLIKRKEFEDGVYIGEFNQGLKEGRGKFEYKFGDTYMGDWKNDKREGKGIYYFKNGNKYEGDFKNNLQDGKGITYYYHGKLSGEKYEGDYKDGTRDGNGIYWFSNGDRQMGNYKQGNPVGKHALIQVNGEIIPTEF